MKKPAHKILPHYQQKAGLLFIAAGLLAFAAATPAFAQSQTNTAAGGILNGISNLASRIITLNNPVQLKDPKKVFGMAQTPTFTLSIPEKNKERIGEQYKNSWQTKDEIIHATLVYKKDGTKIPTIIKKNKEGIFELAANYEPGMKRGEYHLEVAAKESFLYTRNLSQDFTWGVLAINTNKSLYKPGETAKLAMGVVNDRGDTVCNAKLTLTIANPDKQETQLSTNNKTIGTSPDCGSYKPTPDYSASYKTTKPGRYFMRIVAQTQSGTHEITDYFEVKKDLPFEVERLNFPTRVYPAAGYPVEIKIKANQDYAGQVVEPIPSAIQVTNISNGGALSEKVDIPIKNPSLEVLRQDKAAYGNIPARSSLLYADKNAKAFTNQKAVPLNWNVNWKKGQTYTLSYTLNFAPIAPEFFLAGPIQIGKFQEARPWQFAIDASKCWGGTVNANWSTANNWVTTAGAAATLGSADVAVFDSSTTTCTSGSTNNNSTLDASFGGSVQAVSILTYTGTITQNLSLTITTGGVNVGFSQTATGSTWTGNGAYNITMNTVTTSDFNQTAGTFTAPTGTITVNDSFTSTGGTFTAGTGSVVMALGSGAGTLNTNKTFNNLNIGDGACQPDITVTSATTTTVTGTLTVSGGTTCNPIFFGGGGTIDARGNINVVGVGGYMNDGNATKITLSGTASQTITGETDTDTKLPSIVIQKTGGTLALRNTIVASYNWTNNATNTTFDNTGSTIAFGTINPNTQISGSETFNNVIIGNGDCFTSGTYQITSGTVVTATGNLTLNFPAACVNILDGPGSITVQGNITTATAGASGNVAITLSGTGSQTINHAGTDFPTGGITVNKSGGSASLAAAFSASTVPITITAGTFDLAGFNLTASSITVNSGIFKLQGAETVTATKNFNTGSTVQFSGTNNATANTYTVTTLAATYYNLTINNAETGATTDTFQLGAALSVTNNFTLTKGTFDVTTSNYGITIGGNWANSTSPNTFTARSGTVTFNTSATATLSGATTFYNFTSTIVGKAFVFPASTTTTISNNFTITGSAVSKITLSSSTPGTRWSILVSGTASVFGTTVTDSNNTGTTITAQESIDGGNNVNWLFTTPRFWKYKKAITIDYTKVSSAQTNFPVLIKLASDGDLASDAQDDGDDIYFTSSDGTTVVPHEIESFDGSTGALIAWVKVPSLSASANTVLYMYYGNPTAASQQNATAVWDSNYKMVQHLKETSGTTTADSTSNAITGTKVSATEPNPTTGQINGAQSFDGVNDQITFTSQDIGTVNTTTYWLNFTDSGDGVVLGGAAGNYATYLDATNIYYSAGSGNYVTVAHGGLTSGTYYHIAVVRNGTSVSFYKNGAQIGTTQTLGANNTLAVSSMMAYADATFPTTGVLDEIRLATTNRSAGWILTEYNNQSSPSTFFTLGAETIIGGVQTRSGTTIRGGTTIKSQ